MASVLQSANSLIQLDLSDNELGDCGIQLLSQGLSSPHCRLQTLRLVMFLTIRLYSTLISIQPRNLHDIMNLVLTCFYTVSQGNLWFVAYITSRRKISLKSESIWKTLILA